MPLYEVEDPSTGAKLQLEGAEPPTDADLDEIFASLKSGSKSDPQFEHMHIGRPESLFREMTGETEKIVGESLKAAALGKEMLQAYEPERQVPATIGGRISQEYEQLKRLLTPGDQFGERAEAQAAAYEGQPDEPLESRLAKARGRAEESLTYQTGQAIIDRTQDPTRRPNPLYEHEILSQGARLVGDLLPSVGSGVIALPVKLAGRVGTALTGIKSIEKAGEIVHLAAASSAISAAQAQEQYEKAIKAGATEEQAAANFFLNLTTELGSEALVGAPARALSTYRRLINKESPPLLAKLVQSVENRLPTQQAGKAAKAVREWMERNPGKAAMVEGVIRESPQEGGQQILQNLIDKFTYKPDQDWSEGVVDNLIWGGVGGFLFGAGATAFARAHAAKYPSFLRPPSKGDASKAKSEQVVNQSKEQMPKTAETVADMQKLAETVPHLTAEDVARIKAEVQAAAATRTTTPAGTTTAGKTSLQNIFDALKAGKVPEGVPEDVAYGLQEFFKKGVIQDVSELESVLRQHDALATEGRWPTREAPPGTTAAAPTTTISTTPTTTTEVSNAVSEPGAVESVLRSEEKGSGEGVGLPGVGEEKSTVQGVSPQEGQVTPAATTPTETATTTPEPAPAAVQLGLFDKTDAALTRLIEATDPKGKAFDFVAGVSHAVANSALKIARLALRAGRSLSDAIQAAVNYVRLQVPEGSWNEEQFRNELIRRVQAEAESEPPQIDRPPNITSTGERAKSQALPFTKTPEFQYLQQSDAFLREAATQVLDHFKGDLEATLAYIKNPSEMSGLTDSVRATTAAMISDRASDIVYNPNTNIIDAQHWKKVQDDAALVGKMVFSEKGQGLNAAKQAARIMGRGAYVTDYEETLKGKQQRAIEGKFPTVEPQKIKDFLNRVAREAIDALAGKLNKANSALAEAVNKALGIGEFDSSDPVFLQFLDAVIRTGKRKLTTPANPNLVARIQQMFPLMNMRKFLEEYGGKQLNETWWKLLSGPSEKEQGPLTTADAALQGELKSLLQEAMERLGLVPEKGKKGGPTSAEKLAMILGKGELRLGKIREVDKRLRAEMEERKAAEIAEVGEDADAVAAIEAKYETLADQWDEVMSSMAADPASKSFLRRMIHQKLKDAKLSWNDIIKSPEATVAARERVANEITKDVQDAATKKSEELSGLMDNAVKPAVLAVFDEIASIRKAKREAEAAKREAERPEQTAKRFLNKLAESQSDTLSWSAKVKNAVQEILTKAMAVNAPFSGAENPYKAALVKNLTEAGVRQETAESLANLTWREKQIRQRISEVKRPGQAAKRLLNKARKDFGETWKQILTSATADQGNKRDAIVKAILARPEFQGSSDTEVADLANLLNQAWMEERQKIAQREFDKVVGVSKVKAKDKAKLKAAMPELVVWDNLGLLNNDIFRQAVAARYGVKRITVETSRKIHKAAQESQTKPEGAQKREAEQKIIDILVREGGVSATDLLRSYWYASVLSSPSTQGRNLIGNATMLMDGFATLGTRAAIKGRVGAIPVLLTGMLRGMRMNAQGEFGAIFNRGADPSRFASKQELGGGRNIFEAWQDAPERWKRFLSKARWVGRLMTAVDSFFYDANVEMKANFNAFMQAKEEPDTGEINDQIGRIIRINAQDRSDAERKAQQEIMDGLTNPKDLKRRTNEILRQWRHPDMQADTHQFGLDQTLNNHPEGLMGLVAQFMLRFRDAVPALIAVPYTAFVNISANGTNALLRRSPAGLLALLVNRQGILHGKTGREALETRLTNEQYQQLRAQVLVSHIGFLALGALALQYLDDDDPELQFTGSFTRLTPQQRSQLASQGIRPYQIRIKGRGFDYRNTPAALMLAIIGNYSDAVRYSKADEADYSTSLAAAVSSGLGVIIDQSFLSGLAALFDRPIGNDAMSWWDKQQQTYARAVTGLVPSILKDIDRMFEPNSKEAKGFFEYLQRDLPILRWSMRDRINVLGDPIERPGYPWSWLTSAAPDDPIWDALAVKAANGVFVPAPSASATVIEDGERRKMTEDEFYDYAQRVGELYREQLEKDMTRFQAMTPEQAKEYFHNVFSGLRDKARGEVQREVR